MAQAPDPSSGTSATPGPGDAHEIRKETLGVSHGVIFTAN